MRNGPELVRASNAYAKEDRATTWRLLLTTLALWAGAEATLLFTPSWWIRLPVALLSALLGVRLFIFYHDYLHGAILTGSKPGKAIMHFIGYWTLAGPSIWKQTHDYHHKHTSKMVGASIGSFPIVSTDIWRSMNASQRRDYRLVRSVWNMVFGYFTVFMIGMCIQPWRRNRQHVDGPISLLLHFGLAGIAWATLGPSAAIAAVVLPTALATGIGSYLFYAQHTFPGVALKPRQEWDYSFAALHSSSMMDMPPILHWLTGNIGYHHVHHLNHRIPFYRLPEAMAGMPELQSPARTSLAPKDVLACLRLNVWDPDRQEMVGYHEIDDHAAAAK